MQPTDHLSDLSPADAAATLRSLPRRFRSMLAPVGSDDPVEERARRIDETGWSALGPGAFACRERSGPPQHDQDGDAGQPGDGSGNGEHHEVHVRSAYPEDAGAGLAHDELGLDRFAAFEAQALRFPVVLDAATVVHDDVVAGA